MKLKKLRNNVYYLPNNTNIGVIKEGSEVIIIDTGLNESDGREILNTLKENDFNLKAIINTHAHIDHCGGNSYLRDKTGAEVYASEMEDAILKYPYLEPLYLFSGANPIQQVKDHFLSPKVEVSRVVKEGEKINFSSSKLEVLSLSGHSLNQIGILVNGVLFCGDALTPESVLKRIKIPYHTDVNKAKETLTFLKESDYQVYLPAHGEPISDIREVVETNLARINEIERKIIDALKAKKTTEDIAKELTQVYEIRLRRESQYYLVKTMVLGYLSALKKRGRVKVELEENVLYWKLSD